MKVEEIVYYCLDAIKAFSDDSYVNEEHVLFLIGKYRAKLLKSYYQVNKNVLDSNYQVINVQYDDAPPTVKFSKSLAQIPTMMDIGNPMILLYNYMEIERVQFVPFKRIKAVGYNNWKNNFIYASVGPDNHFYLNYYDPNQQYLQEIKLRAVFEDWLKADEMSPNKSQDVMNIEFPLETTLIPDLIALVVKDVLGIAWRPADTTNDAADSLGDIATYVRQNMKKRYNNTIEGNEEADA